MCWWSHAAWTVILRTVFSVSYRIAVVLRDLMLLGWESDMAESVKLEGET